MHVEQYLQQMQDEGKSSSYLSKLRGMLFQVMNRAEANDLIRKNPVRFAEKMRNNGPVKEKDSFSAEEVHRLMQYLPFDRIGLSIRVMLGTGLRSQEMLALEPKHIEPDGSMIHVRQAVKLDKGVPYVGKTKSRDSVRDIPVPEGGDQKVSDCTSWLARADLRLGKSQSAGAPGESQQLSQGLQSRSGKSG